MQAKGNVAGLHKPGLSERFARAVAMAMVAIALFAASQAFAQDHPLVRKAISLTVEANGELPGFDMADVPQYLISRMFDAGVGGWGFVAPTDSSSHAANRVEWRFHLNPYASGSVRQIIPIPAVRRLFGTRYLVNAEVRLYLDGEYQTASFGQVAI